MSRSLPRGVPGAAHVLGLCDLSPASMNAAVRAVLVSRELGLPLRLLYRAPEGSSAALPPRLASFVRDAADRDVDVLPVRVERDPLADCAALAKDGLLVLATRSGNPLCDWLMGTPAERLIRLTRAPTLVVRQPADGPYRRALVPVDLRGHGPGQLGHAAALVPAGDITLFHALSPASELVLHEMDAPPQALRAMRRERSAWAHTRMELLIDASDRPGARAGLQSPIVAFGSAGDATLAAESACRADLVVIGKRRRGLLADFLLGSVTRQVLAGSQADVLVVPMPPQAHEIAGATPHRETAAH